MRHKYNTANLENKFVASIVLTVGITVFFLHGFPNSNLPSLPGSPPQPIKTVTFIVEVGVMGGRTTITPTEAIPVETSYTTVTTTTTVIATETPLAIPSKLETDIEYSILKKVLELSQFTAVWLTYVKWAFASNVWPVDYQTGQTQVENCRLVKDTGRKPWQPTNLGLVMFLQHYCKAQGIDIEL